MLNKNRFNNKTKEILAKRVNFSCSKPGCTEITIGPHSNLEKTVNLGEAAHIYGANIGSARYEPEMTEEQRSHISNGIWLCRKHAKLIDSDPELFSAQKLFIWKESKEREVRSLLFGGEPEDFDFSDSNWEYKYIIKEIKPIVIKAKSDFKRLKMGGMYRSVNFLNDPITEVYPWSAKVKENFINLLKNVDYLLCKNLNNIVKVGAESLRNQIDEFISDLKVLIENIVNWEINIYFTQLNFEFNELLVLYKGMGEFLINKIEFFINELSEALRVYDEQGIGKYTVTLEFPELIVRIQKLTEFYEGFKN